MPDSESITPPDETTAVPAGEPRATEEPDEEPREQDGARMVSLAALKEARREIKKLKQEKASLLERASQAEANAALVQRFVETLQQTATAQPAGSTGSTGAPEAQVGPSATPDDADAQQLARDLYLLTPTGELDLERARRMLTLLEARVTKTASQMAGPTRHLAASAMAQLLRERAYKAVHPDGTLWASREAIDQILGSMSPEDQANPHLVSVAVALARGLHGPGGSRPPTFVETGGRPATTQPQALSDLERQAIQLAGLDEKRWRSLRDKPGYELE